MYSLKEIMDAGPTAAYEKAMTQAIKTALECARDVCLVQGRS